MSARQPSAYFVQLYVLFSYASRMPVATRSPWTPGQREAPPVWRPAALRVQQAVHYQKTSPGAPGEVFVFKKRW